MTRKGFALIEAVVTLFVVAVAAIALLDLVVMARRLAARRQESAYAQGLLNSALTQTMTAVPPQSQGTGSNGAVEYTWTGTRTQQTGYRKAVVTVTGPGAVKFSGELVKVE